MEDPRRLAARVEALDLALGREWVGSHRRLHPDSRAAEIEVGGGAAIYIEPDSKLNKAIGLGMQGPITDADFGRLATFFRERRAPVVVEASPFADPTLARGFGRRGYRPAGWKQVLTRPIEALDSTPAPAPRGVTIERVRPALAAEWVATVGLGFNHGAAPDPGARSLFEVIFHADSSSGWIARVEGEPAAASCLALGAGIASLASTSTRPEFRRRGIHSALIAARLAYAAANGCRLARASCNPGADSQRNFERAGFRVICTRAFFVLPPGS